MTNRVLNFREEISHKWEVVCKAVWIKYEKASQKMSAEEKVVDIHSSPNTLEITKIKSIKFWWLKNYILVTQRFNFEKQILEQRERSLFCSVGDLMSVKESAVYRAIKNKPVEYLKVFTDIPNSLIEANLKKCHTAGMDKLMELCSSFSLLVE